MARLGDLVQGRSGLIGFTVTNTGTATSTALAATVALPKGVTFVGVQGSAVGLPDGLPALHPRTYATGAPVTGWSCSAATDGATCMHPALAPGESTTAYLRVDVAERSLGDTPVTVTVSAAGLAPITLTGERGIQKEGLTARFSGQGALSITQVGNTLMTCPIVLKGCTDAQNRIGTKLDNNDWNMTWYDADGDPSTYASSAVNLAMPSGATVRWAGLYWSGSWDGTTDPTHIKLRGPADSDYTDVTAAHLVDAKANPKVYQAFADVTSSVRAGGGGTWSAADPTATLGSNRYAGWSLVVVFDDPTHPGAQVTVFDGIASVQPGRDQATTITGVPGAATTIGAVLWESDASLVGDSMDLNGAPLTPVGGSQDPNNVADSSSDGAIGPPLTFGTNVDTYQVTFPAEAVPVLTARSTNETFYVGVITVSSG